jgi:hypothetical protein
VVWSYGGNGDCDGSGGIADAVDSYRGLYGEDRGYWLPELLEHMASHGIVSICPALAGLPSYDGADDGVSAARMLADLQPCRRGGDGVTVDSAGLGIAGYSLGAGRAVQGAAGSGRDILKAVVALHTWRGGRFTSVAAPLMIVSASEASPVTSDCLLYPDVELAYKIAQGYDI